MARDSVSSSGSHPQLCSLENGKILISWDEPGSISEDPTRRIGVELRNNDGRSIARKYTKNEKGMASYPVITSGHGNSSIIAFSEKIKERKFVKYMVLELN